jgi:hypothetical protein
LGFSLPGLAIGNLARAFAQTPLTRFAGLTIARPAPAPQSFDRPPTRLCDEWCRNTAPRRGSPHRLLAPVKSRAFRQSVHRDMCSPCTVSYITADQPMLFGEPLRPTAAARTHLRCRAFATSSSPNEELRTLVVPFGVFGSVRRPCVSPQQGRPLRIGRSLRVVGLLRYCPYWLGNPTLPLTVSSAVWSFRNRLRWELFSYQSNPLSSFASV